MIDVFVALITIQALIYILYEVVLSKKPIISFSVIGSVLFVLSLFGPYFDLIVYKNDIFYSHLVLDKMAQAMSFGALCLAFMMSAYFWPCSRKKYSGNLVLLRQTRNDLLRFTFYIFYAIWLGTMLTNIGGIGGIFYSEQARFGLQFDQNVLFTVFSLLIRVLGVLLGLISCLYLIVRKIDGFQAKQY